MKSTIAALVLMMAFGQILHADESLPFIVRYSDKREKAPADFKTVPMGYLDDLQSVVDVESVSIKKLLKSIRSELCSANPKGEFQASFSVDASGKVLGLGASATSGLQATIKCE